MNTYILIFLGMLCTLPVRVLQAQEVYRIQPSGSVEISGTSTISDWTVKSQTPSGHLTFSAGKTMKANATPAGTITGAQVFLEVESIKSEKSEAMDNKMYGALKQEQHPQITFQLTEPLQLLTVPAKVQATGTILLAGLTRPMTFDLDVEYVKESLRVTGTRSLKLSDFEIEPPTAMFGQIETGDEVTVKLDLHFSKQ